MKKLVIAAVVVVAGLAGVAYYTGMFTGESAAQAAAPQDGNAQAGGRQGGRAGGFPGGGGRGGFRGGNFGRQPLTVELGTARRASISDEITVVGNLIGEATVAVAPRAAGRLQEVYVRLGDRVARGQRIARIEDFELQEQIKQAEAAQEVASATIRQREADLALAKTNVDRSQSLFEKNILPKQTLDDNVARYQSAQAQLDLARAQAVQSKARLDELKINLANTIITSPTEGFISRRLVDPGASVGQNAPVVEVVDISRVRLVANVVERDLKQLQTGDATRVQVDAYPGETFTGRIARVSPILDPATRTAPIEIEIPNPDARLKPGMYARVGITMATNKEALVIPSDAMADLGGRRGVFQVQNGTAIFRTVQVGTEQGNLVEIVGGLTEGEQVITTGARALRDGDPVIIAGAGEGRGRRSGGAAEADGASLPAGAPASVDGYGARRGPAPGGGEGAYPAGRRRAGGESGFAGEGSRPAGDGQGRPEGRGRRGARGAGEPAAPAAQ
jgi:membrane fusion protein, multidrug efflux system